MNVPEFQRNETKIDNSHSVSAMNDRDTMRVKTMQMIDYNRQVQIQNTIKIDTLKKFYWLFALYVANGVWTKYLVVACIRFVYIYD